MKETSIGICVSVALHFCALPLFVGLSAEPQKSTRTVLVDFTLIKGEERTGTKVLGPDDHGQGKKAGISSTNVHKGEGRSDREIRTQGTLNSPAPRAADSNLPVSHSTTDIHSDPSGNVAIQGEAGGSGANTHSGAGSPGTSKGGVLAAGWGSGSGGQGSGSGGTGFLPQGKDFNYIRSTVIKNLRYPERARRIGAEGKVLLSFIVLEDGSTGDVKVLKGSGFSLLDESAKEAVTRTTIQKKVPYRVVVVLPIVYELH
ncbi:MAG: Gram-negative bacterial tonB protein [Syntrophorhabdus sp. PtaU1.Bin153]|nr:MAG: Gram-negative bacterial tonB protein [Syntrophorhabdus sp. PtaU1.Bin153]